MAQTFIPRVRKATARAGYRTDSRLGATVPFRHRGQPSYNIVVRPLDQGVDNEMDLQAVVEGWKRDFIAYVQPTAANATWPSAGGLSINDEFDYQGYTYQVKNWTSNRYDAKYILHTVRLHPTKLGFIGTAQR